MASYSNGNWTAFNFDTSMRHRGGNPWNQDDFINLPQYAGGRDENYGSTTREQGKTISVRVRDGEAYKWSTDYNSGDGWVPIELDASKFYYRNESGLSGIGLGVAQQQGGFTIRSDIADSIRGWAEGYLDVNYRANEADAQQRAENVYWNNTGRFEAAQAKADEQNDAGDKEFRRANTLNKWSENFINRQSTLGNGYLGNRAFLLSKGPALDSLVADGLLSQAERDTIWDSAMLSYRNKYVTEMVDRWDYESLGAQPPVGGFDSDYYLTQNEGNQNLNSSWYSAVQADDVDITERYGNIGNYAWQNYSTVGKGAGYRGNAPSPTTNADIYKESFNTLTDAEKQYIREGQLGLTEESESGLLGINWEDTVASELEGTIGSEILEKKLESEEVFGSLVKTTLKDTIAKLEEAEAQERELDIFKGLPGFSEIYNINSSLSNSILGDSGLGGYLGLMGQNVDAMRDDLQDQLGSVTGVNFNSSSYNWQKWLDEELTTKINELEEIEGIDSGRLYELKDEFKNEFINSYINPRFDQSKSMNEFISYMDTIDEESQQNIFQTQTAVNSLREKASIQAANFYSQLKNAGTEAGFNSAFYFDPYGASGGESEVNDIKAAAYKKQGEGVQADFLQAIENPNLKPNMPEGYPNEYTWSQLAYLYGYDLPEQGATPTEEQKAAFARLHYEAIGRARNYDPAQDVVTQGDVNNYLVNTLLPAMEKANFEIGDKPYLDFVTPNEFADALLEGIDPLENKEDWKELLDSLGLSETAAIDEVKEYLIESFQTGAAKEIREGIKYLNEKKLKPTQEKLGVAYIERDSDQKEIEDENEDGLYNIFKNAGYAGSVDEFYDEFMPEADRGDMEFLNKALSNDLSLSNLSSDPFEALSSIGGLLGDEDENIFGEKPDQREAEDSYFSLFDDDEGYSGTKVNEEFDAYASLFN